MTGFSERCHQLVFTVFGVAGFGIVHQRDSHLIFVIVNTGWFGQKQPDTRFLVEHANPDFER